MRYLLDTNIISYLARDPQGRVAARTAAVQSSSILTSVIVIGEISYGFAKRPAPKLLRQTEDVLRGIEIVDLSREVSGHYAAIRASLELKGTPISANHTWIAAHALACDATLVTANEREFRRVSGLKVENWAD